ncbi:MAG TPA: ABC transporter permease [Azospirillaceae bacterium]|nr:ABC transporter permease [Azospirillaceae bacterium]
MSAQALSPRVAVGGALALAVVAASAAGVIATPYDPVAVDLAARIEPPSAAHWLGTDQFGRDLLSRLMAGGHKSLLISLAAVLGALLAGVPLGVVAGYAGGWVDRAIGTVLDALMAFPSILVALGIMSVLGPSEGGVVLALALAYAPAVTRVARASALSSRRREFVDAARVLGMPAPAILLRHVLPHCVAPVGVLAASLLAAALLTESALSFLGVGVPPPAPTWGGMLAEGRPFIGLADWLTIFPGLAIALTLLAINLLGDALRDRLDPRMRAPR